MIHPLIAALLGEGWRYVPSLHTSIDRANKVCYYNPHAGVGDGALCVALVAAQDPNQEAAKHGVTPDIVRFVDTLIGLELHHRLDLPRMENPPTLDVNTSPELLLNETGGHLIYRNRGWVDSHKGSGVERALSLVEEDDEYNLRYVEARDALKSEMYDLLRPPPPPPPPPLPLLPRRKGGLPPLMKMPDLEGLTEGRELWGEAELVYASLVRHHFNNRRTRKRIYTEEGVHLKDVTRIISGASGFRRTTPYKGGALLVDASSSMEWEKEDLIEIVKQSPQATVALYSGDWKDERGFKSSQQAGGRLRGKIVVVARNGLLAAEEDIKSPGDLNAIDGPALRWLASQPEPRVWYTDGGVNGVPQPTGWNRHVEVVQVLKRAHRIIQTHDMEALVSRGLQGL